MKFWTILLLLTFTIKIGVSQDIKGQFDKFFWTKDTVIKKGQRFRLSNLAIEIGIGGKGVFNDKQTEKHFGNYWTQSLHVSIYYKNFFLVTNSITGSLKIIDTLKVGVENVSSGTESNITNDAISFGYNIDFTHSMAIQPYVGLLYSSFTTNNKYSNIQYSAGFTAGLSLNKYFTLRPKRQLGIFINGSYNQSNYHNWNKDLGKYYYAVDIGIVYKFWILKKIK